MRSTISSVLYQLSWAGCAVAIVCMVGCDSEPRRVLGRRTAQPALPKSTPTEAFQNIVVTLRRAVADQPGISVFNEDGAFSKLQFHREIKDELIPPSDENDRYQGRITVTTKYSYRYRPPVDNLGAGADDIPKKQEANPSSFEANNPLDITDPALDPLKAFEMENTDPSEKPSLDNLVPRNLGSQTEDEETNTYELEYVDDRWVITTRIDPNEDEFMHKTFEFALKRQ